MRHLQKTVLLVVCLSFLTSAYSKGYYVDAIKGNNSNTEQSVTSPWKTLKVNNTSFAFTNATNVSFDHNIYFGLKSPLSFSDKYPVTADPMFNAPGKGKQGYRIMRISPAIKAGIFIQDNASSDFYGNKIIPGSKLNIGIDNE